MRLQVLLVVIAVGMASRVSAGQDPGPRPQAPGPVFRAGVELVSIDVTALDGTGRQVMDLTAGDFQVEIDGQRRQVSTVEYIRAVDPMRVIGAPHKVVVPDETFSSSNAKGAPRGRLIVLLIDHGNIRTGAARAAMDSARKFVDTLTPEDRVAVIAVPGPGELVDFTINHDRVRESLLRIVGTADAVKSRFNLSITEAIAIYMRSDTQLALQVILRECGGGAAAAVERCEREVENDASEIVNEIRRRTQDSLHGMRTVLQSLAALDGPKSVILISEGLIFEGLGAEADDLGAVAADSRATLDVLLLDVNAFDVSIAERPTTPRQDRELQVAGLEQIAGAARGELYRINTTADFAFDRISRALDGYYLLGVESRPEDKNGRRHRIGVRAARRGVSIRSRRSFVTAVSGRATTPADAVARAIKSPLPINDLPLKVSTWNYKEPGGNRVRVLVAAEVERLANQPLDYTVGMAIVNRQGRSFSTPVAVKTLIEKPGDPGTALFSGVLAVEPGQYRVILSMSDSEGRIGSVTRAVTAFQVDAAAISIGDLIVGPFDGAGAKTMIEPAIEPVIAGPMAAMMEAYSGNLDGLEGVLDILASEDATPIATVQMRVGAGQAPEIANVSAQFNAAALPPGRYLARGTIRQNGKPQGHLLRPFRIVAAAAGSAGGAAAAPGLVPNEMAMMLLGGIANFDRKELLTPSLLTSVFAMADSRPAGSKAAVKEARGGDLGSAAMTALGEGDQVLATFLKGLELYQAAELDRAAMQFTNSMQMAPAFTPSRLFLGAALAEGNRHKDAAGLLQSAAASNASVARLAGEEWLKAGQPALAITPLELAAQPPNADARARKLLGFAYVLGGRPTDAATVLSPYLEGNPTDAAALLAAIYSTYQRHLAAPRAATLAADKVNVAKWAKAYAASKGPILALVTAWAQHVQGLE